MIREGSRSAKFHTVIDGRRDPALYFANVIKARRMSRREGFFASLIIIENGDYKYDISLLRVTLG